MQNTLQIMAAGFCCLTFFQEARADEVSAPISVGVTGGSLGVGPEIGYRVSPLIGARIDGTFLRIDHSVTTDDLRYAGRLHLESYGFDADIYPFKGGFRLSAGVRIDKNRIGLVATPSNNVTIDNKVYTPAQIGTLSGNARVSSVAPTVTLGYHAGKSRGLKFGIDGGAMFMGSPHVGDLTYDGTGSSGIGTSVADEETKINAKLHKYDIFPILQLSVGYNF